MRYYGFNYYKSSTHKKNRIYWNCRLRHKINCKARIITVDSMVQRITSHHNHDVNFGKDLKNNSALSLSSSRLHKALEPEITITTPYQIGINQK